MGHRSLDQLATGTNGGACVPHSRQGTLGLHLDPWRRTVWAGCHVGSTSEALVAPAGTPPRQHGDPDRRLPQRLAPRRSNHPELNGMLALACTSPHRRRRASPPNATPEQRDPCGPPYGGRGDQRTPRRASPPRLRKLPFDVMVCAPPPLRRQDLARRPAMAHGGSRVTLACKVAGGPAHNLVWA